MGTLECQQGPDGRASLTAREVEVVEFVVEGLRDREIAGRLGIAPSTVRAHLANVREKLGARSRVDVAVRALRAGVVPLERESDEGAAS